MTLYEFQTGRIGESHERAYVWASSEEEAERVFKDRNPRAVAHFRRKVLDSDTPAFSTLVSDSGWEE